MKPLCAEKKREAARKIVIVFLACPLIWLYSANTADAQSEREIDLEVDKALTRFYAVVPNAHEVVSEAAGILVFPRADELGHKVGGMYGKGALRVGGKTTGYFTIRAAGTGSQAGPRQRHIIIAFLNAEALTKFLARTRWKVGITAGINMRTMGTDGRIDMLAVKEPIMAIMYDENGLIQGVSLRGSRITRMNPEDGR